MKTKIAYSPFLCVVLVYTQLVLNKPIAYQPIESILAPVWFLIAKFLEKL